MFSLENYSKKFRIRIKKTRRIYCFYLFDEDRDQRQVHGGVQAAQIREGFSLHRFQNRPRGDRNTSAM